jgi:hypothetical protein
MNGSTWATIVRILVGLGAVLVIDRYILPDLDFMPTSHFIFAMEKLAMLLIAGAFIFGEIQKHAKDDEEAGLRLRDVGLLLVAVGGSGLIYLGLTFLAGA